MARKKITVADKIRKDPNYPVDKILDAIDERTYDADYRDLLDTAVKHPAMDGKLFRRLLEFNVSKEILDNPTLDLLFLENTFVQDCIKDITTLRYFFKYGKIIHLNIFFNYIEDVTKRLTNGYNHISGDHVLADLFENEHFQKASHKQQMYLLNKIYVINLNYRSSTGYKYYPYKDNIETVLKYFQANYLLWRDFFSIKLIKSLAKHLLDIENMRIAAAYEAE